MCLAMGYCFNGIDPIHLTSSSEYSWHHHTGGQCHCALFSEVRILGDAAFTSEPIAIQNGEQGTVAVCDMRVRGQLVIAWGGGLYA